MNQNLLQSAPPPKKDDFYIMQNTGYKKAPFCCNPQLHQKLVFYQLVSSKVKPLMLNKKHSLR